MNYTSLIFLLLPALINTGFGDIAKPESVGMSSERLERIGPMIDRFIEQKFIGGAVTLVARRGSIVHLEAHGKFSDDSDEALTTDAIFDIASMTKPVTQVAALMLVEDGKVGFDDELFQYLPDFKHVQVKLPSGELVPAKEPIRIQHLFRDSSGLAPGTRSARSWEERAQLPLLFHPGEYYRHPESTAALGWVVEAVSQQSLVQFFKERIFKPLSMDDTDYGIPSEKRHRDVTIYTDGKSNAGRGAADPNNLEKAYREGNYLYPAGMGLYSTAEDYWKFCQMILNGGEFEGKRLIGRTTLQRIFNYSNTLPALEGSEDDMNLGFNMVGEGGQEPLSAGSYYKGGGRGTRSFVDPSEELIGILMIKTRDRDPRLYNQFLELIYAAIAD